jgi:hypothetical protein
LSLCICLNWRPRRSAELDEPPGVPKRGAGDEADMVCVRVDRGGVLLTRDGGVSAPVDVDSEGLSEVDVWKSGQVLICKLV